MIDPTSPADRRRVATSADYWNREFDVYRKDRRELITNYIGSTEFARKMGFPADKELTGNLIQMAAQGRAIQLAYGPPRYMVIPRTPMAESMAMRGKEFLNTYCPLIGLGTVARQIALDSYFGYGVVNVDMGLLPPAVQHLTGQQVGPTCRRISQDNFLFDGEASEWQDVSYVAHTITVPLDTARTFEPFLAYNADGAQKLQEYNRTTATGTNTDSRIHSSDAAGRSAMRKTRLALFYFPHAGVIAIWGANAANFKEVAGEPLLVAPWTGHHTGPYAVLTDLDIPDNILPIAQSQSTKRLHYLFNSLADITSEQALAAKINPAYEMGQNRDVQTWMDAKDREPVPVSSLAKLGVLEIPGPSQGQTSAQYAALQMFKEFSGNLDDVLGLGATAATARQSELIRSATTARGGDMRRRMNEVMELVGRKLLHLALNDQSLRFPMRVQIPRTKVSVDMSWLTPNEMPRPKSADDFELIVAHGSMEFRSHTDRLRDLREATAEVIAMAQAAAAGVPIDLEKFIDTQAEYRDLPELRDWFTGMMPTHAQQRQAAAFSAPDPNKGHYVRENVSTRTGQGGLIQAMTQFNDEGAGGVTPAAA